MKSKLFPVYIYCLYLLLAACDTPKKAAQATPAPTPAEEDTQLAEIEQRNLDTLVVTAPIVAPEEELKRPEDYELPTYNASHTRRNDLLHTRLDLRFDWDAEQVLGKATLQFQPLFYPVDQLVLDAKGFEFHKIQLENNPSPLSYDYDGDQVTITLDRTYERNEKYTVIIEYTASPAETGGSAAITSDQGLFFIKPDDNSPDKPMQIWTQGETEWNSRWFPTIDKPNERCTQEMYLTVEDRFETLSNGLLVSSKKNDDGTRTDYWKMDLPHAPYLFMIAIGDFAVVREKWEGIPVEYYVEPEFEADAKAIFPYTVEMLDFFSEKLQVKYPWPKYDQVVVRDYVSGAMENTTAVIFGEFMQKHSRELIDERTNEKIVAHEMFHHWFGDLVTCESWANLTMNEGFANYSEYLWLEHKYGADEADYHLLSEWGGYLSEAQSNMRSLINFAYNNKESMFDAHSYNKGGAILHMLRKYVGDEAFWAALNLYLTKNQYTAVEAHNLRLAFEEVTGEDLNWFFNQWYFSAGHPQLNITYDYDPDNQKATVTVEQTQDPETAPAIFQLPAAVDIYLADGEAPRREQVMVSKRLQTFSFDVPQEPKLVIFDADHVLLAEKQDNKTREQLLFQYNNAKKFFPRFEAVQALRGSSGPEIASLLKNALSDDSYQIRGVALNNIDPGADQDLLEMIRNMATADPNSQIRSNALYSLAESEDEESIEIAKKAIEKDSAYTVVAAGLHLLTQLDKETALQYAQKLEQSESSSILEAVGALYSESGDPKYLSFFEKNLTQVDGFDAISHFTNYQNLAVNADLETIEKVAGQFGSIGMDMGQSPWRRLAAMNSLNDIRNELRSQANAAESTEQKQELESIVTEINQVMDKIKSEEKIDQLKNMYNQMQLIDKV